MQDQQSSTAGNTTSSSTEILPSSNSSAGENAESNGGNSSGDQSLGTGASAVSTEHSETRKLRGNPGNFAGKHLEYLQKHASKYTEHEKRSQKTAWLNSFIEKWFILFPWHLSEEPKDWAVLSASLSTAQASTSGNEGSSSAEMQASDPPIPPTPPVILSAAQTERLEALQIEQQEVQKAGQAVSFQF